MSKLLWLAVLLCAACAPKPVLYPNAYYKKMGTEQAQRDTAECYDKANEYVHSHKAEKIAGSTVGGAATGAAVGAVTGAFSGQAGRGAAEGGAVGAIVGLAKGAVNHSGPSPVFRNFVDNCLTEKGYQPIGWE